MKRYISMIVLVLLLACCTALPQPFLSPLPASAHRSYLPAYTLRATAWALPKRGYSLAPGSPAGLDAPLRAAGPTWFYDWTPGCRTADQVPMIWGGPGELPAALKCNDGRPLLLLNEPERKDQANISPAATALLLYQVAQVWAGPIYCCGWSADPAGLDHMLDTVAAYRPYGPWPAYVHVHSYANIGSVLYTPDGADWKMDELDAFHNAAVHVGLPVGGWVLSEYGGLNWYRPPAELVTLFQRFDQKITARPWLVSAAWYIVRTEQNSSNLIDPQGKLTALGSAWVGAAKATR